MSRVAVALVLGGYQSHDVARANDELLQAVEYRVPGLQL